MAEGETVSQHKGKPINQGLTPGKDPCRHCGGLHFGSGLICPYLCVECGKETRADFILPFEPRCECDSGIRKQAPDTTTAPLP
jgi:hypothetical protein